MRATWMGVVYASNPPKEAHNQGDTGFQVCSRGQSAHFAEKRSVCGSVRLDDPGACAPVSARGELFSSTLGGPLTRALCARLLTIAITLHPSGEFDINGKRRGCRVVRLLSLASLAVVRGFLRFRIRRDLCRVPPVDLLFPHPQLSALHRTVLAFSATEYEKMFRCFVLLPQHL